MADLLLTLGHNSSAIVADESKAIIGYETERITKKKSDSQFPQPVIDRLEEFGHNEFENAFVTHWEPTNNVDKMAERHWDRSAVQAVCSGQIISQEDVGLTHHDTHAYAAVAFAGGNFPSSIDAQSMVLVVDGFGNFGEHISAYTLIEGVPKLKFRVFGYFTSIGLMYQYATDFLGMKMHEDEYKLLGYQSKIPDLINRYQGDELHAFTVRYHNFWRKNIRMEGSGPSLAVSMETLPSVKVYWAGVFQKLLNALSIADRHSLHARVAIAHFVQSMTEMGVRHIIDMFKPRNLIVSGGVFMNVGLNAMIAEIIPGLFCAHPLSGDQGNAVGLRFAATGQYADSNLRIGKRKALSMYGDLDIPDGFIVTDSSEQMYEIVACELARVGFVNIVRGDMEFGSRALCNTSTIAMANSMPVVSDINRINGRNTVMPFAPVMSAQAYSEHFELGSKIWKSDMYMITALECGKHWAYEGAALRTHSGKMTARPQVIRSDDPVMSPLLKQHGVLINTSFNVHGVPIVLDIEDAIHSHNYQRANGSKSLTLYLDQ